MQDEADLVDESLQPLVPEMTTPVAQPPLPLPPQPPQPEIVREEERTGELLSIFYMRPGTTNSAVITGVPDPPCGLAWSRGLTN